MRFDLRVDRSRGHAGIEFQRVKWTRDTYDPSLNMSDADNWFPRRYFAIYPLPKHLPSISTSHISGQYPLPLQLPPCLVLNSDLSYKRAQDCLKDCTENHVQCRLSTEYNGFMPKRILELHKKEDGPHISLIANPPSAAYTSLSYCWGEDQPAKTTKQLLSSYEHGIVFQSLPKTVQDAVLVTLGLGIHYLWVDAMCIIQDDELDKSLQISQMHTIYRCSTITIAASMAASCNEGFLHNRKESRPYKVTARISENVFTDVVLRCINSSRIEQHLPLFRRAWTLQEISLSRRILSFTADGMIYRCLETENSDFDSSLRDTIWVTGQKPGLKRSRGHPYDWCNFAHDFAGRSLSMTLDKLPAIGALAAEYSRQYPVTRYYAGLWRENILEQLLWSAAWGSSQSRPQEYVAPS